MAAGAVAEARRQVGEAGLLPARVAAATGVRRQVVLASADATLRRELTATLAAMRWEVREARGGAELFERMEAEGAATVLLDSWLPDLEVGECVAELRRLYPRLDVLALDGTDIGAAPPVGPFRNELLHALRSTQSAADDAAWKQAPREAEILAARANRERLPAQLPVSRSGRSGPSASSAMAGWAASPAAIAAAPAAAFPRTPGPGEQRPTTASQAPAVAALPIPELLGTDPRMLELVRRIQLVAPRSTSVLVQGPTGTGKELVARAIHRLSPRAGRPFVALNCAAIPEALLEAELFGHTRGAFTGAVQGRTGRIEAANGGTLFLDEIGELPLALQAKLLRFVECGELQRVGENEPVRVDVRIVAATHRRLRTLAEQGSFRADLYYRLSVFLVQTPALAGRRDDIALLARHTLARLAEREGAKVLAPTAMERLLAHTWPGNVRELQHTIERAWILAGEAELIGPAEIDFGAEDDEDDEADEADQARGL